MAQYRLNAYDADVWVDEFRGLSQADINLRPDMRFASDEKNVETPDGVLQPQAAIPTLDGEFESRVETLASFHRRWYTGTGSHDWYVCCVAGKFYQRQADDRISWQEIELPEGVAAFELSTWSWVTYEINPVDDNNDPLDPVDVLLVSNATDGMYMIVPPDRPSTWGDWEQHTWTYMKDMTWLDATSNAWHIIEVDAQGKKFGVIERYAERIWGADIADNPDMLMYSAPYDPTNWEADPDIPEDGAGDIMQPSWDGDKFYAIHRYGDHLLAYKKNRIWSIRGTNPGEFSIQEQFGGGTSYFNTIAVDNNRVYMESEHGLNIYDGMNTTPYLREYVEQIWNTVNKAALDQMCAVLFRNRYYVAIPVGDSMVNNAMLMYDLTRGTILYYSDVDVEAFLPTDKELFFTSSSLPGQIRMLRYDSWLEGAASGAATRWATPWVDFGYKRIQKGGFDLYLIPEVQTEAVTLKISVQTEKKLKTKNYTVKPLTEEQREAQKEYRGKRLHFGGTGRKFRIIIETEEGVTAPWRLIGGLQMVVETDPD